MEDNHNDHIQHITPLSPDEQETAINWFSTDTTAYINTAEPKLIRILDDYSFQYPDLFKCIHVDTLHRYKIYTIPRKNIQITKPRSEAQTAAAKRNIAHANNKS